MMDTRRRFQFDLLRHIVIVWQGSILLRLGLLLIFFKFTQQQGNFSKLLVPSILKKTKLKRLLMISRVTPLEGVTTTWMVLRLDS